MCPSASACLAVLTARSWLLCCCRGSLTCLVAQVLMEMHRSCLIPQESRGSLSYLNLHLCAFLVASSAHGGSVSLHASTSLCFPSLPLTMPLAPTSHPTRAGVTWLSSGTPREVLVDTYMLVSDGALVQPCKHQCDASWLPSHG